MTKLARAAAQQLKGIVVEYDAFCSTLIGRTAAEQAEQRRRSDELHAQQERARDAQGVGMFSKMVTGMFVTDVRSMLKDLNQDSTGKPWIVKERLQSTLQGLPTDVLDRVTGDKAEQATKTEEEVYLEKQLASATAELERMKLQRANEKEELLKRRNGDTSASGGVRDKYLDKLNQLKAKAKTRDPKQALSAFASVSAEKEAAAAATPAKGLTTWLVHDGANELMSYATLRGLAKAMTPPQSHLQEEEFRVFCKEMQGQFDYFMPVEDYAKLPDTAPLMATFKALELSPLEVLVIARHSSTIRAAKAAGAHTCHFRKSVSDIPNHSADYQLVGLTDFQYIVEEFNGISYRGYIPQWHPSQF